MSSLETALPKTGDVAIQDHTSMPRSLVMLMAASAGFGVASIYYSQPMLGILASTIHASSRDIGFIPTLTQLGYAAGILLLAPLGDRHDRRKIILIKSALLIVAMLAFAAATSLPMMLGASLIIGMMASLAQDVIPAAAAMAPEARRGKIVGTVMTGLLMGILLSRVVSGVVSDYLGWRALFVIASVLMAGMAIANAKWLPRFEPTTSMPYRKLLGSLGDLLKRYPALRYAALAQGLLCISFSAFWSTLAIMLHSAPFHLGSSVAGAFGLAGAAGALAAPMAGHLADKRGPQMVTRFGTGLTALSFALLCLGGLLTPAQHLWLLVIGTIGFDLGVQSSLIAHQSIIYALEPAARSRLNAVLITGMFIGMAAGSAIGTLLLASFGWIAVTVLATVSALGAFGIRFIKVSQ